MGRADRAATTASSASGRRAWAASREVYFYVVAVSRVAAIAALWRVIYAPFGYTLRAARDSALRADAIGIDVRTAPLLAFTLAGARGRAGRRALRLLEGVDRSDADLHPACRSISWSWRCSAASRPSSGPLVGAAVFHSVKDFFMPLTDFWRFFLGLAIIAMVLAFPRGIVGALRGVAASGAAGRDGSAPWRGRA